MNNKQLIINALICACSVGAAWAGEREGYSALYHPGYKTIMTTPVSSPSVEIFKEMGFVETGTAPTQQGARTFASNVASQVGVEGNKREQQRRQMAQEKVKEAEAFTQSQERAQEFMAKEPWQGTRVASKQAEAAGGFYKEPQTSKTGKIKSFFGW